MSVSLHVTDDVAGEFAERVIEAFHRRPNEIFSIALSGGETARACYERLSEEGSNQIDWWKVDVYWGDERCVPLDDPDSNYRLARESLLDRVGAANATYPMDCGRGARRYQSLIESFECFDVVHLGLGPDGHTASLFPGSRALDVEPGCLVTTNVDELGDNPHDRMTLTFEGIARSRLALFTVVGEAKHSALAGVVAGDPLLPATRVQADNIVWLVDPTSSAGIEAR